MPRAYYKCEWVDPFGITIDNISKWNHNEALYNASSSCSPPLPGGLSYTSFFRKTMDYKFEYDFRITSVSYMLNSSWEYHIAGNLGIRIIDDVSGIAYKIGLAPILRTSKLYHIIAFSLGIAVRKRVINYQCNKLNGCA